MARKAKQHIVPQTYLKGFCDPSPPDGWPAGKPFTPALWIHATSLDGEPRRGAPSNVAWARNLYNLRKDNPNRPWLEEAFGKLENLFAPVLRRVEARESLGDSDRAILCLFVGALHERTPGILAQRQELFDQVGHFSDQYDPKGRYTEGLAEMGKRQMASFMSAFAEVAGPHAMLIENRSGMPFITSDAPVTYRQLHADDLYGRDVPADWLYKGIPRSARHFFIFCPLSPTWALASSEFILPSRELLRRETTNPKLVFRLNEFTRRSASSELYSSVAAPYGDFVVLAWVSDRELASRRDNPVSGLSVYSATNRYWLPVTSVSHGHGESPLHSYIQFRSPDLGTLREMAADGDFVEITIIERGQEMGGMRGGAWLSRVALDPETESRIDHDPTRPAARRP